MKFKKSIIVKPDFKDGGYDYEDPGARYKNIKNLKRNVNGVVGQKYCKFNVPSLPSRPGIYILRDNGVIVYVGKTKNLMKRWSHTNYGLISPRNVFEGGQSTNCKINHYINEHRNDDIEIEYIESDDIDSFETSLINAYEPMLNIQGNTKIAKREEKMEIEIKRLIDKMYKEHGDMMKDLE